MYHFRSIKRKIKSIVKPSFHKPILGNNPAGGPKDSKYTILMLCGYGFDINVPNAKSTIRLGFCRGFAKAGVKFKLISVFNLEEELEKTNNPIVFSTLNIFYELSKRTRKKLRDYKHFVWVDPKHDMLKKIYKDLGYEYKPVPKYLEQQVVETHPNFVFAPVPPSALDMYGQWIEYGLKLESIPFACDVERYYPTVSDKFKDITISFVGGYWKKKAIQLDKYLKPLEDKLTIYGYSEWPYEGYQGSLPVEDEKILYKNSTISPAISEPHAKYTGDIVERVFKIMGSKGLAITDAVPFYQEMFNDDELLIPKDLDEYFEMVKTAINDKEFNITYRKKGYKAILERHTYLNRAEKILNLLNIKS